MWVSVCAKTLMWDCEERIASTGGPRSHQIDRYDLHIPSLND